MIKTILLTPPLNLKQRLGTLSAGGAVMPGLGVLYIAALLRKRGFPVMVWDAEGLGVDSETTVKAIVKQKPDILGITTTTLSILSAAKLAKAVKKRLPQIKIFLGGPHVTALPQQTMEGFPEIDGCILGDGELTFAKIVDNIQNKLPLAKGVAGLAWRQGLKILINPRKCPLANLDSLPFPAWDLLKGFPKIYRPPFHSYRRLPVANIVTSRGCPNVCAFCDRSVFGQKIHSHSIKYVMAMIEHLVKNFGIKEISIKDDTFVVSHDRVIQFCRQLRKKKLNLVWSCNARVNLVNDHLLKEMKKAGCWLISYGIESGSPKMLKKMKKNITKEQIVKALELTRKNGIVSKGFFMIGVPGETSKTLAETLDFVKKLPLDEMNINFFTPFPGSELFQETLQQGFQPDFSRMNMLEPVYVPKRLSPEILKKYQKQIIYAFYLRPFKIGRYLLRALKDFNECKRILRMAKMFVALSLANRKQKQPSNQSASPSIAPIDSRQKSLKKSIKIHLITAPTTFPLNYGDLGKGVDPPLGILYIASYLRKYGPSNIDISVTDGILEGFETTVQKALASKADLIGISAVTSNIEGAYKIIKIIKDRRPQTKVILGGPHPTALPLEAFERSKPDIVVIGEGEETFKELAQYFSRTKGSPEKLKDIDGICIKQGSQIMRTNPRKFIQDLDTIPFPARDLVDLKRYKGYPVAKAIPSTSILTSRGCPFHCTFCSNNVWRSSAPWHRARSPKNVADELEELTYKWGYKEFFDSSDEFNTNITHTKNLLREIISRKLPIHLKCQLRAKPIDEELAQLMKQAGIWYVHVGIESGNNETLKGIRKMITLDDVENCCRILKKYDIKVWGLFMYFNIWEEDGKLFCEDYEKSLNTFNYAKNLAKDNLIDYFGGSITTPFPGSELWDIAKRHRLIKKECLGNYDLWFYKKDLRLVSRFPNTSEESIFKLQQKTFKHLVKSLILGRIIRLGNLRFNLVRALYFIKRQILMTFRNLLPVSKIK